MADAAKSRNVLVTGGTGSVGAALTTAFRSAGHTVVFQYYTNQHRAEELQRDSGALPLKLDLSRDFELSRTDFDIVINNAGINICDDLVADVSFENWRSTLAVNLDAPFRIVRACLPHMVKMQWGRVINISSIYGLRGSECNLPYTVSKHGLSGLTKTVAREYSGLGITSNEICPGPIDSEMMTRIAKSETTGTSRSPDDYLTEIRDEIPAKRFARPEEVASLAVYLARPESGYINGVSIPIDGAYIV